MATAFAVILASAGGYRDRLAVEGAGRAYWGLTRPRPDRLRPLEAVDLAEIAVPTLVVESLARS